MSNVQFDALEIPIVQAPMAGGVSTPALAAAVSNAGGLGFLAAGYQSAARFEADIRATRALTPRTFGVNVFAPQPSAGDSGALEQYRLDLLPVAAELGVEPATPHDDDDQWDAKLDVIERLAPSIATFTFGTPDADTVARLRRRGTTVGVTVTNSPEARTALDAGAAFLVVQGPEAGGHRGTFDPAADPDPRSLDELLHDIVEDVDVPVVAAGGIDGADRIRRLRRSGASVVQLGTAFLLADEAGTKPAHAHALQAPAFTDTTVTRAFSGRYARGLVNDFVRRFDGRAPLGYPQVNQMTAPIRAAAAAAENPELLNLWAGTAFKTTRPGTAKEIFRRIRVETAE